MNHFGFRSLHCIGSMCAAFSSAAAACGAPVEGWDKSWYVLPGSYMPGSGPDGNSVFLDAPDGLILVDTGRHPAHQEKVVVFAKERGGYYIDTRLRAEPGERLRYCAPGN